MPPFRLVTLGSVHVEGSQWRPGKVLALLAYLSVQGPTSRRRLRELFWPDAQDPGASLRVLLGQVRRQLPGAVTGDETVEFRLSSDASELLGLGVAGAGSPDALDLYGGPFLAGLELADVSSELHEWVLDTRDRLAAAARLAAVRAAELAGSPAEAGQWAKRAASVLEGPPMEPELIERLLRLALPGSLLEADLRREQAEYREEPSSAWPALETGPELLGREQELDSLLLALTDPDVRLLEITGPGGIGKSMLAAALLREQADLSGVQVAAIPLETVHAASEAAARLAAALNLKVTDRGDSWLAFTQAWGERPLLVLLDGAEGLSDLLQGVQTLLTACPGVRVVVTSRVRRLTLAPSAGSVHLALDGLRVPVPGDPPERVARSAAVQLFVRGARRYLPRFALDEASLPLVSSIVRRLEGHPLATVLSATWLRVYPLARIHTQILHDLTALRAENGVGDRHHLAAVFEHSWRLLNPAEAQAVAGLAVFRGFTPAAAKAVADVPVGTLDALKRHSLLRELRADSQGTPRLEVPAVLAAQAQTLLDDVHGVRAAHSTYYLDLLMGHAPESDAVNDERDNIVAAAGFAVSQGQEVSAQIDALLASYDRRGLLANGSDAFRALQEALLDEESPTAGSIFIGLAWLAMNASNYLDAETVANQLINNTVYDRSVVQMKAYNILSNSLRRQGKIEQSLTPLQKSLDLAIAYSDTNRSIMYLLNMSEIYSDLGNYKKALENNEKLKKDFFNAADSMLRMSIEMQNIAFRFYSEDFSPEENRVAMERFLECYKEFSLSEYFILIRLMHIKTLIQRSKLNESRGMLRELSVDLRSLGYKDFQIAKEILEVEVEYASGQQSNARKRISIIYEMIKNLGDTQAYYDLFIVAAHDLNKNQSKIISRLLNYIIYRAKCTYYTKRRAEKVARVLDIVVVEKIIDGKTFLRELEHVFLVLSQEEPLL